MTEWNYRGTYKVQSILTPSSSASTLEQLARIKIRFYGLYRSISKTEWNTVGLGAPDSYHNIHFVRNGSARVYGDDMDLSLEPGFAYWTPSNVPLARECKHYLAEYFLRVRCELIDGVDIFTGWPHSRPVRLGKWDKHEWSREWRKMPASLSQYMRLQGLIFGWMAQSFGDIDEIVAHHIQLCGHYDGVFKLIERRLGADLLISDLAKTHGSSLHAFSMAFRRDLGINAKTYLNRRLNQEACQLVLNTEYSVREIATRLQFADEHYFSRFFSKMNGMPPIRYRQTSPLRKQRLL